MNQLRLQDLQLHIPIVVAFLNLLNFPLGTLLGFYTLWVLLQTSANEYFSHAQLAPA